MTYDDDDGGPMTTRRYRRRPEASAQAASDPFSAQLIAVRGPAAGRRFPLSGPAVVGRDETADVVIDDDGVSRSHFEIDRDPTGAFWLKDLGSRNGTMVNGREAPEQGLRYGDRISVGANTTLLFAKHDAFDEQLLRAQRLQSLGELAAGIAHDFNNILAAILGNISYLRAPLAEQPEDLDSCHHDIEVATRKGVDLVGQLLAFAQNRRIEPTPRRLGSLVDDLSSLLSRTLRNGVTLEVDVERNLHVVGDDSHLGQLLANLCINGADAMPEGGVLSIRGEAESVDDGHALATNLPLGDYVRIDVVDRGTGMDAETKRRAFEPFFTTKPRGQGTGLGLATVARIVELHGGHLQIESREGKGTTVRVWLPRGEAPKRKRRVLRRATLVDLGENRMLLVDDEEIVLRSTARLLERSGARVITAGGGAEAVELFRNRKDPIKLVVLDLDMPEMDGAETLRRIREIAPEQPALLVTGHIDPDRLGPVLAEPGVHLLNKPYDYRTLADAVDRALGGSPTP